MKQKKIIQRNLPLSEKYTITGFSYVPLLDGIGCTCDNCGKLIANMVKVTDSTGKAFTIGQDCAETLTRLKDSVEYMFTVAPAFAEGKQTRAKLLKHLKTSAVKYWYLYTSTDTRKFIVGCLASGGSSMFEVHHPNITLEYVKDILVPKPSE